MNNSHNKLLIQQLYHILQPIEVNFKCSFYVVYLSDVSCFIAQLVVTVFVYLPYKHFIYCGSHIGIAQLFILNAVNHSHFGLL